MPAADRPARSRVGLILAVVAAHALIAAATNVEKWRPRAPGAPVRPDDTVIFHRYAGEILRGEWPYRDFVFEYPPIAVPAIVAPRLVAASLGGYQLAFAAEMMILDALLVALVASLAGPDHARARRDLGWYTLFFLFMSRLWICRFDALPTLLGFAAAAWWARGRPAWGGVAAALGTLAKFYPALVAAASSAGDLGRPGPISGRIRGAVACGLTLAAGMGAWAWLGTPAGLIGTFRYHSDRGLEYMSFFSGLQMVAAKLAGAEIRIDTDHVSFAASTPWTPRILPWTLPIQLAAIGLAGIAAFARARRGLADPVRDSAAMLTAFIVFNKVFSPQLVIAILPMIAILAGPVGPPARRIFAVALAPTIAASFVTRFVEQTHWLPILVCNAKNLSYVALYAVLVAWPSARPAPGGTRDGAGVTPA